MQKLFAILVGLAVLLSVPGATRADEEFRAILSGANEVPSVDTDTSGKFKIEFNEDETAAEYKLVVLDGVQVTQAHLHCAFAGSNGGIFVFLAGFHDKGWDVDGVWINNATITDANIINTACGTTLAAIAQAMRDGKVYVNVHTFFLPLGEIRGQVE